VPGVVVRFLGSPKRSKLLTVSWPTSCGAREPALGRILDLHLERSSEPDVPAAASHHAIVLQALSDLLASGVATGAFDAFGARMSGGRDRTCFYAATLADQPTGGAG
jgi:hypothetical protein